MEKFKGEDILFQSIIPRLKKTGKFSTKEIKQLDFDNIPKQASGSRTGEYYGIQTKKNRSLAKKVKSVIYPLRFAREQPGVSYIYDNPAVLKKVIELVKKAEIPKEGFDTTNTFKRQTINQLKKSFRNVPDNINIAPAIEGLVNSGRLDKKFLISEGTGLPQFKVNEINNKILKIVDKGSRTGKMPSLTEIAKEVGFKGNQALKRTIVRERGQKFYNKNFISNKARQIENIKTLAKDLKIQEGFKNGRILEPEYTNYAAKLLGVEPTKVRSIIGDTALAAQGKKTYNVENIKLGQKGIDAVNTEIKKRQFTSGQGLDNQTRALDDLDASRQIKEKSGRFFDTQRRKGVKIVKKVYDDAGITKKVGIGKKGGVGVSVDELFNLASGTKGRGGAGNSIFGQIITTVGNKNIDNLNTQKAGRVDGYLSRLKQKALTQKITLKDITDFNKISKKFTNQINNTLPKGAKKIKAVTLKYKGDPLKTMPGLNKLKKTNPALIKNIVNDAKKVGFSTVVPKNTLNMYDFNNAKKIEKGVQNSITKAFNADSFSDAKKIIKASSPKQIKEVFRRTPVLMSDATGIGTLIRTSDEIGPLLKPIGKALGKAKPVLKGLGKAAVVIDPVFAAMDFSKAQEEGLSGGQSGIFAGSKFIQDIANLPRTIEDLAYLATEEGTLKNFGQKKDRLLGDAFKAEFADNYLKRKIDETPTATKDYRKANIRYDQSMPNFYDDIEVAESQDVLEARKNAYLKSQGVSKPKKEGIGSFFTNPRITGIYEEEV